MSRVDNLKTRRGIKLLGEALTVVIVAVVLAGCASYQPYDYHDERETMKGPGLFSGKDGVFTIWGRSPDDQTAAPDNENGPKNKETETDRTDGQ